MGWSNYIIIPDYKLLIEVPRNIDDIEDYAENAIDSAIDEENIDVGENFEEECALTIDNVPINKITIKDIAKLYKRYEIVQNLAGTDYNVLLLFWLKKREIDFEIKSEYNMDIKKYREDGYTIIGR